MVLLMVVVLICQVAGGRNGGLADGRNQEVASLKAVIASYEKMLMSSISARQSGV